MLPGGRELDLLRGRAVDDAEPVSGQRRRAARQAGPRVERRRALKRSSTRVGALDDDLRSELVRLEALGLRRALPATGAGELVDLCSNDTLSLSRHARVIGAAKAALERYGAGARASRLLGGNLEVHAQAEAAAARWLGTEAALCFPSAYQANLGVLTALVGRGDELFCDELVHASIVDAARLTRARVSVFPHGDSAALERLLSSRAGLRARRLVVVESVYSMDGDLADLAALNAVCSAHDAWLVVDEAHACGLLGPRGAGGWAALGERLGSPARLAARVIGGGKALGASGAFVVGSRALVDTLLQRARSFVFSTALAPASAAALGQAIELAASADAEREHVHELARELARELELAPPAAAIVPVPLGAAEEALRVRDELARAGL
ncbi:MAG: aminotransferase class I/II-fold pyridoxal phosphate-dependent enzyme, partial [Planctomycetes bacterium]|nr:aminotransferase class I/II-fold pyridoxal phosphate-dependent enzyme [Planctomycetota bacterium]